MFEGESGGGVFMRRVGHTSSKVVAAAPAQVAASTANIPTVDLRRGGSATAGAYVYEGPSLQTGWHTHTLHQLEYSTRGALGVTTRHARYVCPPHEALWISAGTEHRSELGHARTVSVFFAPELVPTPAIRGVRVLQATPLLREMVLYCGRWSISRAPGDYVADSFFATMAALLPDWLATSGPWHLPVSEHPMVAAIMDITLNQLSDVTPRAVGRAVGISERALRRLFATELGISWSTYLTRARLLRAMTLLSTTDHGVLRIASEVGYDSATSLSRALRAWTGATPSQYRARARECR